MKSDANTPQEYIDQLSGERKAVIIQLRQVILDNLPVGFQEEMSYGMIGYVVPHSIYPRGYRANPKLPLPFINIASQKNHIGFYHMGLYADRDLRNWFVEEYDKQGIGKLDMGKSCIRFKKAEQIPYKLIGKLVEKVSVNKWIAMNEQD